MNTLIGETLRTARERRNMTLAEASALTCIRERYLHALEQEQFEALGEDVYVKGFIRSYAKALGVNSNPLVEAYRAEYEHPEPDEAALTGQVLAGESSELPRSVRAVAAVGTVVLAFALLVLVGQRSETPTAPAPVETTAPVEEVAIDVEGTPQPEPEPEPEPQPQATPTPPPVFEGVEVTLAIAGAPSWLRVIVDGDVAFEGLQQADTTVTFAGDEEVFLRIGNAGAVQVVVNGEDHGTPGGQGEVVERSYRAGDEPPA